MRLFFFVITFLFLSYIIVIPAKACSCRLQGFDSANSSAATIFVGKVISIEQLDIRKERVTLEVKQSWKGATANSTEVFTRTSFDDACGYYFRTGKSYLIYTFKNDNGTFWVSACSRTSPRKARQAKGDIKKLNERIKEGKTKTNSAVFRKNSLIIYKR